MQFIVTHFGGKADAAETPEYGAMDVIITEPGDIFDGIKSPFKAWESHNDEVKVLPDDFINLAHSETCKVQGFKYTKKPYYGLQFHPEVEHTEQGSDMFQNFVNICEKYKK